MGNSPVDRNSNYMREMWGTTKLVTDYYQDEKMTSEHDFLDNLANHQHQKMLSQVVKFYVISLPLKILMLLMQKTWSLILIFQDLLLTEHLKPLH